MPDRKRGLFITTIFTMYPSFDDVCNVSSVHCVHIHYIHRRLFRYYDCITSTKPLSIVRCAALSVISLLTPMGNDCFIS